MCVRLLEFLNDQAPEGFGSFDNALWMTSIAMGNYVGSLIVTIVMDMTGWIPEDLNRGRIGSFCFLFAFLITVDFVAYVICARRYKGIAQSMSKNEDDPEQKI